MLKLVLFTTLATVSVGSNIRAAPRFLATDPVAEPAPLTAAAPLVAAAPITQDSHHDMDADYQTVETQTGM